LLIAAKAVSLTAMTLMQTRRLSFRDFMPADAASMEAVFGDSEVMRYSDRGIRPPGFAASWVAGLAGKPDRSHGIGYWAVIERSTEQVTGYISLLHNPNRCRPTEIELGFRLSRRYWGQGYATEAGAALIAHGMSTPPWRGIIAIMDPNNAAAVRVAEKLGMTFQRAVMFDGYDHPDHLYAMSRSRFSRKR